VNSETGPHFKYYFCRACLATWLNTMDQYMEDTCYLCDASTPVVSVRLYCLVQGLRKLECIDQSTVTDFYWE